VKSTDLFFDGHGTLGPWREVASISGFVKDQRQAVRIGKGERRRATPVSISLTARLVLRQSVGPVAGASQWEWRARLPSPTRIPGFASGISGHGKNVIVGSGMTFSVRIKQVIRSGRILV